MSDNAEHPRSTQPIALDAMGGDLGVAPLLEGALAAADDGAHVIVVGDAAAGALLDAALRQRMAMKTGVKRPPAKGGGVEFVEAEDVVTMDDTPQQAAKKKRSSMRVACNLVAEGKAAAVVSVANSGAMVAVSSFVFGRLKGVARPAIGTVLPSYAPVPRAMAGARFGRTLLVDAGANTMCTPLHLAQFGVMGSVYLEHAFGLPRPKVAVLSNGEEEHKGTPLSKEALALLQKTDVNVVGYCEGRDLTAGDVHVVVTDGFTGNIVLKASEGVFSFMSRVIKETFEGGSVVDNLGGLLSKPGWARIKKELDPREFGAAPLLGLARPSFIAHGKSDAVAVRGAVRAARRFVDNDVTAHIAAAVERNAAAFAAASSSSPSSSGVG